MISSCVCTSGLLFCTDQPCTARWSSSFSRGSCHFRCFSSCGISSFGSNMASKCGATSLSGPCCSASSLVSPTMPVSLPWTSTDRMTHHTFLTVRHPFFLFVVPMLSFVLIFILFPLFLRHLFCHSASLTHLIAVSNIFTCVCGHPEVHVCDARCLCMIWTTSLAQSPSQKFPAHETLRSLCPCQIVGLLSPCPIASALPMFVLVRAPVFLTARPFPYPACSTSSSRELLRHTTVPSCARCSHDQCRIINASHLALEPQRHI